MKTAIKYIILLCTGGALYACCELIFRGYTFREMALVGGICFVLCGLINECMEWETPMPIQMLICAVIVTAIEFISGVILNIWLGLNMWDYSQMKFNIMGQICPQFFAVWYCLALPAIILDDWMRWKIFGEEKPKYYFIFKGRN